MKSRLKTYDVVVSDNVLKYFGQERTLSYLPFSLAPVNRLSEDYIRASENLLRKNAPLIIANSIFAANYLHKYPNVHFVGLFGNLMGAKHENASDILVTLAAPMRFGPILLILLKLRMKFAAFRTGPYWSNQDIMTI